MTATQMEKILIAKFGPLGATAAAYEKFLHIGKGILPKDLEHSIVPGGERVRYCPKAVAEWATQFRVPSFRAAAERMSAQK
jgi:hypothetical protein